MSAAAKACLVNMSQKEFNRAPSAARKAGSSVTTSWRTDVRSISGTGAAEDGTQQEATTEVSTNLGTQLQRQTTIPSHLVNETHVQGLDLAAPMEKIIVRWQILKAKKQRRDLRMAGNGTWTRSYKSQWQHWGSITKVHCQLKKAVDEAFDRAMKKALNAADEKKVKLAFASVRTAIATQTQPSSTSSSQ